MQEQAELTVLQRQRFDAELHLKTVQIRTLTRELSQLKEQAREEDETFECIKIVSSDNSDDENWTADPITIFHTTLSSLIKLNK